MKMHQYFEFLSGLLPVEMTPGFCTFISSSIDEPIILFHSNLIIWAQGYDMLYISPMKIFAEIQIK